MEITTQYLLLPTNIPIKSKRTQENDGITKYRATALKKENIFRKKKQIKKEKKT